MNLADAGFEPDYGRVLARRNGLCEWKFLQWAFHPGMLFNSREKWWGDGGPRQRPHEGLDIGFFQDLSRNTLSLPARAVVPVMFSGEVLAFGDDDFFGVTLYVRHPDIRDRERVLCTIYGHVGPDPELCAGKRVRAGEVIATVSDFGTPRSGITAHLHLSVAWILETAAAATLTWDGMNDSPEVQLIDPMVLFTDSYASPGA